MIVKQIISSFITSHRSAKNDNEAYSSASTKHEQESWLMFHKTKVKECTQNRIIKFSQFEL